MTRSGAPTPTDADIIRDSLADPAVFGPIFDRHLDAVYGYLVRRGDTELADDLTGEVFRVAFEQRHRFDLERSSARPWLYGIAANVVRRHWRTWHRRGHAHRRLSTREGASSFDDLDRVDAAADAHRQTAALDTALAGLARRDREPLLLHVWEELSYEEIAEVLAIPIGTVRSRLHRARRKLRASLTDVGSHQPSRNHAAAVMDVSGAPLPGP